MRETLKLGYFVEDYPTFLVDEILELRRLGATITLFSAFRPEPQADPKKDAMRRESVYFPRSVLVIAAANARCALRRPGVYASLLGLLRREGESVRVLALSAYFAERARHSGIRHLHGMYGTKTAMLAHVTARLAGVGYSFTTHAYDIFTPNPSLVWKTRYARFMRTISRFNKRYLEATYPAIDSSKIHVAYLGVDTAEFAPSASRTGSAPLRIFSVGDLFPKKGHIYLIRACARLAREGIPFECDIVGVGFLEAELAREIETLGLAGKVRLVGRQDHAAVRRMFAEASVFVLACVDSREQGEHMDGIPVALMEAMASGVPVVSTRVAGIPELIEDGVSGALVPERDDEALAGVLRRLAAAPELREALGRAARERVESSFDLHENMRRFAALFERYQ
jgi:colanic acid/amylovoran biosynthesis glycosyltransferase